MPRTKYPTANHKTPADSKQVSGGIFPKLFLKSLLFAEEQRMIPINEDNEYDERQDPGHIEAHTGWEGRAFTGIGLLDEVIPSPALAAGIRSRRWIRARIAATAGW